MSPLHLMMTVCLAQVLAQVGAYALPALLPTMIQAWSLSNSEAGWVTSIFYAGYTLSVPLLVSLTDRIDPRRVYCGGVAMLVCSHLGFALVVDGFWGAMVCRSLAGIGWAGTYMPGLKVLSDVLEGRTRSRGVSWHAASVGISGALSFVVAGSVASWLTWRWAFGVGAVCAALSLGLAWLGMPAQPARVAAPGQRRLLDFRMVLVYGVLIWLDSSSLTAGTVGSAEPDQRGATLAVHSTLGYAGGFVGPLMIGWILDLAGGRSVFGWGIAFAHVAVIMLVGPLAMLLLRPKVLAGDGKPLASKTTASHPSS